MENNINFKKQYTFPDLRGVHGGKLRFDFAIFDQDNKLSHLIEYNGKQHYIKPEGTWGDGEAFAIQQQNDQIKIQYCKEHDIELRIIKYDQNYTLEDLI